MASDSFSAQLELYGPGRESVRPVSLENARDYCRRLATSHYENFTVASWMLPRELRQHFYNVYAYCRWSDDLADETGDCTLSLELLDWWELELSRCYDEETRHPVFVALKETIGTFDIPIEPFRDLLTAFRQDQTTTRYESFSDLLGYCRNSANPVGRLVLYLGRCHEAGNADLSDSVCTGLQLANFWQDVAVDYVRGRIYLPLDDCRRFGYDESTFALRETTDEFRRLMLFQVERAETYLQNGRPLIARVPKTLRTEIALFISGGLEILRAIRRIDYDVWAKRPTIGKLSKLRLLLSAQFRRR